MAKKTCTLSLDEETIKALDEASKVLGMSRSMVANQVLGATLGDASISEVLETMFASAKAAKEEKIAGEEGLYPAWQ